MSHQASHTSFPAATESALHIQLAGDPVAFGDSSLRPYRATSAESIARCALIVTLALALAVATPCSSHLTSSKAQVLNVASLSPGLGTLGLGWLRSLIG